MRWAGEAIDEDADALEDALSVPACRMLLLLELLIQLFILLLHVVSEAVGRGIVEGHGGQSSAGHRKEQYWWVCVGETL